MCVSAWTLTSNGNVIETLKNAIDAKRACTYSAMIMTWNALARCTHFFVLPSIWQVCCFDKMICHMWINWNRKVSREIVAPKQNYDDTKKIESRVTENVDRGVHMEVHISCIFYEPWLQREPSPITITIPHRVEARTFWEMWIDDSDDCIKCISVVIWLLDTIFSLCPHWAHTHTHTSSESERSTYCLVYHPSMISIIRARRRSIYPQ